MSNDTNTLKREHLFSFFLGMLAGDGCLPRKYNGQKYRVYPIQFFNCEMELVLLFSELFFHFFSIEGKIRSRERKNKSLLWEFEKYSKHIYQALTQEFEISSGKKAISVRIPSYIRNGSKQMKIGFFLGLLITDGCIRKRGDITFHCGSKYLIEDLKGLLSDVWGIEVKIREYVQKEKYYSYQLTLNKNSSCRILQDAAVA